LRVRGKRKQNCPYKQAYSLVLPLNIFPGVAHFCVVLILKNVPATEQGYKYNVKMLFCQVNTQKNKGFQPLPETLKMMYPALHSGRV
jgi:hypothetical protein